MCCKLHEGREEVSYLLLHPSEIQHPQVFAALYDVQSVPG